MLQNVLGPLALGNKLGTVVTEGMFILDPARDLRRRPDLAFVSAERWPLDRPVPLIGDWEVVPDLAVEVVSPNDVFQDVIVKMNEYFRYGVRQVWIVVPVTRQVFVFDSLTRSRILAEPEELEGGTLLPGFRLPLASLFRR